MSNPTAVPGARATLVLSMAMSLIGITGVVESYGVLTISPSEFEPVQVVPGNAQARVDMFVAMAESPLMKAFDVANLLLSALLVIASVLLTLRRPSALWWTRQALIANLIYTAARLAATIWFGHMNPTLVDAMLQVEGQATEPGIVGTPALIAYAIAASCGALITLGIYALLVRLVRRADVQAFVRREPS